MAKMSSSDLPRSLLRAIELAEESFDLPLGEGIEPGLPNPGAPLMEIQMAKACRMQTLLKGLHSGRSELADGRFYTAIVELSFAVLERSAHAYLLSKGVANDEDNLHHDHILEYAGKSGLLDAEIADSLIQLRRMNRSKVYYREGIPGHQLTDAMVRLADEVHIWASRASKTLLGLCTCGS